ncbi:NDR1/HIN1-like protein 13 [Vicia villosa]|uniref:NDR1/HIN1-like protein 13 n=1 Tax=Vicia villosa TaxID=3911 RepID=UPI00273B028C|nr:NDR1/HIN1-like protein 13 [Vicia villosa]XP_058758887.1 NDR1/HIN1-like protein 13 [Vicia villosa]
MAGQRASQINNGIITTTDIIVDNDVLSPPPSLPPPPGRARYDNMYIVQFPKDQVYRVPPSENALIVERYRNVPKTTDVTSRNFCCCCSLRFWLTIAIILVTIFAIVGIAIAILFFIFNPSGPTFAVNHMDFKNVTGPPDYEISLRAKNPNHRLGMIYESSEVSLIYEDIEVGTGKFPILLEQGRHAMTQFKVDVTGKRPLPKKMKTTGLDFELDTNLCVRITALKLSTWIMNANVVCKFKVNNLGSDTRILSQQCDTNFRQY